MKKVFLTNKYIALIDNDDFDLIKNYKWYFTHGYARATIKKKHIYMHRLIMRNPKKMMIDHINRNGLDNRKLNLRLADKRINALNSKKRANCISKYKGVSFLNKPKKWRAYATENKKQKHLGVFTTELSAYIARKKWELLKI